MENVRDIEKQESPQPSKSHERFSVTVRIVSDLYWDATDFETPEDWENLKKSVSDAAVLKKKILDNLDVLIEGLEDDEVEICETKLEEVSEDERDDTGMEGTDAPEA